MKSNNKTTLFLLCCLIILVVIIVLCALYTNNIGRSGFNYLSKHKLAQKDPIIKPVENKSQNAEKSQEIIPENFELDVPFVSQAPYGLWDALHEDACEEASFLMLYAWKRNQDKVLQDEADLFIKEMVAYQTNLGYQYSITLKQLVEIAKNKYGFQGAAVDSVSGWQDIKETLYLNSSPIIAGMAGKKLNNPNFRNGGPNYHMLVIIGYDKNGFITNDPGTRKGEKYYYTNETLFDALHDYNPSDINLGEKNIMHLVSDV